MHQHTHSHIQAHTRITIISSLESLCKTAILFWIATRRNSFMNATTCGHRHQIQNHQTKHHRRHHHNHLCVLEKECICVCVQCNWKLPNGIVIVQITHLFCLVGYLFCQWMIGEYSYHYAYFFNLGCNETLN